MVHGRTNQPEAREFWTNFGCVPHRYLYESHGIRRGMWTLTWFMDLLGPEFAASAQSRGVTREAVLEAEAVNVPAASDGLLTVLDWLAPGDHPYRKGVMLGFDARHTRGHLYRSIMEAIALTMSDRVMAMRDELGSRLDEVVVSGGGASSALFMQIFADAFGLPATRSVHGSGASLGAAICAAVATGIYPDFDTAIAAMEKPRERFLPQPHNVDLYRRVNAEVYRDIRAATDPILQRTWPLFH
jgi:sugar (pentulose or hexulose) kinase